MAAGLEQGIRAIIKDSIKEKRKSSIKETDDIFRRNIPLIFRYIEIIQGDINQILENIVYMELLRRGYEVTIWKVDCNEIDFVGMKGSEKIYIQVSYLLASEETIEREFRVLEKVPDNYPKYVVSMDEIDRGRNGIKHLNIREFLTLEEY